MCDVRNMDGQLFNIKQEPLDDSVYGTIPPLLNPYAIDGNENKRKDAQDHDLLAAKRRRTSSLTDDNFVYGNEIKKLNGTSINVNDNCGKFQCLICDEAFMTDAQLTLHLSVVHKHTPPPSKSSSRQQSRFARHTCQVCFAKFRTLKDFFNHTSCHAVQPGMSSIDREISARVSNNISKNALQHYFMNATTSLERELHQPSFRCDCCNTLFLNRDSYAMHVMMRVKNESCRNIGPHQFTAKSLEISSDLKDDITQKSPQHTESVTQKSDIDSPTSLDQAYYVDVTSTTDRDEYLLSVLKKTGMTNGQEQGPTNETNNKIKASVLNDGYNGEPTGVVIDAIRSAIGKGKKCSICDDVFVDQDSLAMHVMSKHSNDLSPASSASLTSGSVSTNRTPSPISQTPLKLKYMSPFFSDRMLQLQTDILFCDFCGQSFVNRDTLAMHVLTHTRDHEIASINKMKTSATIAEYLRLARMHEVASLSNLRKLSERHNDVITRSASPDEPLNLVFEKHDQKNDNGKFQDDITVPEDKHTPESNMGFRIENKINIESKDNERVGNDVYIKQKTERMNIAQQPTQRCNSVPCGKQEVTVSIERAASTGCMPSNDYLKDMAAKSIMLLSPHEKQEEHLSKHCSADMNSQRNTTSTETLATHRTLIGSGNRTRHGDVCPEFVTLTDEKEKENMVNVILKNKDIHMCKYCEIIFPSRTLYYLHMGLHNHNTPWQCNMCGKVCGNVNDFNAHVIHL